MLAAGPAHGRQWAPKAALVGLFGASAPAACRPPPVRYDGEGRANPCPTASATTSSLEWQPSFVSTFWICVRAVEYVMPSSRATLRVLHPSTRRSSTSRSRALRKEACSVTGSRASAGSCTARSRTSTGSTASPRAARSIASIRTEKSPFLPTTAQAPASTAAAEASSSSAPLRITTFVGGDASRTRRVPSTPLSPGNRRSMMQRSTSTRPTASTAAAGFDGVATTRWPRRPSRVARASAKSWWSSQMTTFTPRPPIGGGRTTRRRSRQYDAHPILHASLPAESHSRS
jgi:hypothetical protein